MPLRKISKCHQDFLEIIFKVADILNLTDIQYIVVFGSDDVDSFTDGAYKVNLQGLLNGHKVKHSIIVKWHSEGNKRIYFKELYHREYVFYREIVPKMLEIQNRFNVIEGLKMKFPNCVFASNEYNKESIVVMSTKAQGYMFLDRFQKASLEHVALVLKNLAKMHALSFVFAKTDPVTFKEIERRYSKDVQYSDPKYIPKSLKSYYNASVDFIEDPKTKTKLTKLAPDIYHVLKNCTMIVPRYSTICHADCWTNNILYKHQGKKPVDVVFIDYQMARYASPVTDISYFLYMSTDIDLLSRYYDRLLDIYFKTLAAVLRQCNMDVEEVYPNHIFQEHLKIYSVFGLIEALILMKIITACPEEAQKMTEMQTQFSQETFSTESQSQSLYIKRVNGVVKHFFSKKYSLDAVINK